MSSTILQGTEKENRGRLKKKWEKIEEWASIDFRSLSRTYEVRTRRTGLLLTHLWCPNDLARLQDILDQTSN